MKDRSNNIAHLEHAFRDAHVADSEQAELTRVWADLSTLDEAPYAKRPERVEEIRDAILRPTMRTRRLRPVGWAVAAVVAVLGIGGYGLLPVTHTTSPGSTMLVQLPDGSSAEMNENSSLSYRRWLGRRATLTGEAFFDVRHADEHFVLSTPDARVVVEGTRFNVRAADRGTEVYLMEGKVRLEAAGESVLLSPGESSRVTNGSELVRPTFTSDHAAIDWRMRNLSFRDETLRDILAGIAEAFRISVSIEPIEGEPVLDRRLTYVAPRRMNAETLISDVCRIADLKYRTEPRGYVIVAP